MNTIEPTMYNFDTRLRLSMCLSNDTANEFFHRMSNQDTLVLKDFFSDSKKLWEEIINALIENLIARCDGLSEKELDATIKAAVDAIYDNAEFEFMRKEDIIHNSKVIYMAIPQMAYAVVDSIPEEFLKNVKLCDMKEKKTGDCDVFHPNDDQSN